MSNQRQLPPDICRCHDSTCPEREACPRWLGRLDRLGYMVQAQTLRGPQDNGPCPYRIPPHDK